MVIIIKDVDVVINYAGPFYNIAAAVARATVEAKVKIIQVSVMAMKQRRFFLPSILIRRQKKQT